MEARTVFQSLREKGCNAYKSYNVFGNKIELPSCNEGRKKKKKRNKKRKKINKMYFLTKKWLKGIYKKFELLGNKIELP